MNNRDYLSQGFTCVLSRGGEIVFSAKEHGIKPLMYIIDNNIDVKGCDAADKIVGKAAALLYVHIGVGFVYAQVMSKSALELLRQHGIKAECETLTDRIINRLGTDICPMEKTVSEISDPFIAYTALKSKLEQMKKAAADK